jgi:hypothetical protein
MQLQNYRYFLHREVRLKLFKFIKMKKVFLLLSLSIAMFSCTTDNVEGDKTSITATMIQDAPRTTAKEIKRGSIYAWVKDITLTATNNETGHIASELFSLVDNSTAGADAGVFRLDNVAIGVNSIKATSTTNSVGSVSLTDQADAPKDILSKCIKANPYAVYSSPVLTENIQHTPNNVIKIPMNTDNGRIIGVFSASDAYLLNNYKILVTASIVRADNTVSYLGVKQVTAKNSVQFYWSNELSVQGAKVTYTIAIVSIKTGAIVNTMYESVAVKASTSYSCNYVINTPTNLFKDDNKFDFVFQPWKEETCPTCPGN